VLPTEVSRAHGNQGGQGQHRQGDGQHVIVHRATQVHKLGRERGQPSAEHRHGGALGREHAPHAIDAQDGDHTQRDGDQAHEMPRQAGALPGEGLVGGVQHGIPQEHLAAKAVSRLQVGVDELEHRELGHP